MKGTALAASRSRDSDIGKPRVMRVAIFGGLGREDAAGCADGKRRHDHASDRRDTPPVDVFRCRGRSPGSQVVIAPGLPNANPHQWREIGSNSLLTVAGAAPECRAERE